MQHPPYPLWHYVSDSMWIVSYAISGVLAVNSNISYKAMFVVMLAFLCLSRLSGSGGGGLVIIELPILIFLIINSVRGLRHAAFDISKSSEEDIKTHKKVVRGRWAIFGIILLCLIFL